MIITMIVFLLLLPFIDIVIAITTIITTIIII